MESNLNTCLDASQRMLQNCNTLMQKSCLDIPWINTVVYIAAMFTTLFISSMRRDELSPTDVSKLKDDIKIWIDVLGECDSFLGSGGRLKEAIAKIADQSVDSINDSIVKRTATESLARVALQTPQQTTGSASAYDNGGYRGSYNTSSSVSVDPTVSTPSTAYSSISASIAHPYSLGTSISVPQQTSNTFDVQHTYTSDASGLISNHAAALAAVSSNQANTNDNYAYAPSQSVSSAQQIYPANGYAAQDWRQWTRTYMQPQSIGQPGEYLNTATTLMALGRDGEAQDAGSNNGHGAMNNTGHLQWPASAYGHGHISQQ